VSDFFPPYFGRYFPAGFFGPSSEQPEGSISGVALGTSTATGAISYVDHRVPSVYPDYARPLPRPRRERAIRPGLLYASARGVSTSSAALSHVDLRKIPPVKRTRPGVAPIERVRTMRAGDLWDGWQP
jgi:hypothetical protein